MLPAVPLSNSIAETCCDAMDADLGLDTCEQGRPRDAGGPRLVRSRRTRQKGPPSDALPPIWVSSPAWAAPPLTAAAARSSGPQAPSPSFDGWVWVLPASKCSLLPRSPEKQKAAKRWAVLKGHRLHLCVDAADSEAQLVLELASCEVIVSEGAGCTGKIWKC